MTPEQWRQISAVFHQALHHERPERHSFLDAACRDDAAVRREVDRLLEAHDAASAFGQTPAQLAGEWAGVAAAEAAPAESLPSTAPDSPAAAPRDPFLLVVWLCAAITVAAFSYGAVLLVTAPGGSADVGWRQRSQADAWYVDTVAADGPAAGRLQPADRIVGVDGGPPFAVVGIILHVRHLAPGDPYTIAIDRGGEKLSLRLNAVAPAPKWAERLTYFVSSLLWCAIGLWIGAARPEHPLGRLATAAAVAVGLVFLTIGVINGAAYWAPLHAVLAYHFLARFPTGDPSAGVWRVWLAIMYAMAILSLLCGVTFELVIWGVGLAAAAPYDLLATAREVVGVIGFTGSVAGMVGVTIRNYRRLTTDDQRRRVQWVGYAAVVGLAPEVWYSGVALYQTFIGPTRLPRLDLLANILPVVIPLAIAYVIVKHRVLDIKVVVRRTVQHLLARQVLQAAVVVPLVALAYIAASNRHLTVAELVGNTRAYIYWLVAAAVALRYRRRIELWLDRRFFREQYDREQLLVGLLDDVRKVDSISDLSRLVSDRLISALHPTTAYVWYRDPAELAAASSSNPMLAPRDVPAGERWLGWLEERAAAIELPVPAAAGLTRAESQWFATRGVTLIVPILDNHDRLVGTLLMGGKKSDEPYSPGDKQLLSAIARQASVVRENLRLRARVNDDARIRHEVLAKLDARLPDLLKECPSCGRCFDGPVERCEADHSPLTLSLPVARTIDGKYRLDRLIGRGGMGAVYEARDLRLERLVAVKIMRGRAFGQHAALRRFNREARAAARLTHPNIVRVYDIGSLEGEGAYFVMERVQGVTLRAELDRLGRLPPAIAADWFGQVLEGLAAAHAAGLVHRDLKPENVMGTRLDGQLDVKLLDLGLVKVRTDDAGPAPTMTAEGVVMGTLGYMAPEQLQGLDVDERADIYSIGIMLIEALTGTRPNPDGRSSEDCRLPGAGDTGIALNELVQRCLVADPRRRLASAAALGAELVPLLRASAHSNGDRTQE